MGRTQPVLMIPFEILYVYNSSCVPVDPAWNWYCNSVSTHLLLYSVLWGSLHKWVALICIPIVSASKLCGARSPPPSFWQGQNYWGRKGLWFLAQGLQEVPAGTCSAQGMGQPCGVLTAIQRGLCRRQHAEWGHRGDDGLCQPMRDSESWLE